jgi:hypothetical protein
LPVKYPPGIDAAATGPQSDSSHKLFFFCLVPCGIGVFNVIANTVVPLGTEYGVWSVHPSHISNPLTLAPLSSPDTPLLTIRPSYRDLPLHHPLRFPSRVGQEPKNRFTLANRIHKREGELPSLRVKCEQTRRRATRGLHSEA